MLLYCFIFCHLIFDDDDDDDGYPPDTPADLSALSSCSALDLSYNRISDEGAGHLADLIQVFYVSV